MKMGTKGCPTIAEFIAQNDLYPTAGNLFYMPEGFYEGVAKTVLSTIETTLILLKISLNYPKTKYLH